VHQYREDVCYNGTSPEKALGVKSARDTKLALSDETVMGFGELSAHPLIWYLTHGR
jgi:hypothetical protein